MTMFSANTFVVWGSIAFDVGMVAVMINLMYGVAALLAGYFVASRWKAMGVETPANTSAFASAQGRFTSTLGR